MDDFGSALFHWYSTICLEDGNAEQCTNEGGAGKACSKECREGSLLRAHALVLWDFSAPPSLGWTRGFSFWYNRCKGANRMVRPNNIPSRFIGMNTFAVEMDTEWKVWIAQVLLVDSNSLQNTSKKCSGSTRSAQNSTTRGKLRVASCELTGTRTKDSWYFNI